jgi:hypothetical protein
MISIKQNKEMTMTKTTYTETLFNPFYCKKALLTSAIDRSTSKDGAARIVARELHVPFQVARAVLTLNDRKIKRLCATK